MAGLGLVAPVGVTSFVQCPAAEDAHSGLAVPNRSPRSQGENSAREPVHQAARGRHRGQVAEAISDDEIRVLRGREQRGDRSGWMLAVSVDEEHCLGCIRAREQVLETRPHGGALPAVAREPEQLGPGVASENLELGRNRCG